MKLLSEKGDVLFNGTSYCINESYTLDFKPGRPIHFFNRYAGVLSIV